MPTPFYHLSLAEDLLRHPDLPAGVRQFLEVSRCDFLFGTTAPDAQVVSGQPRLQTHFFDLPIQDDASLAWEEVLRLHPALAHARHLPAKQAAFMAGYLCHLQADWIWVKEIFAPTFGPRSNWGTFRERLYLHNILRAYLDVRILPHLHPGMATCLQWVVPDRWLPFIEDRYLVEWRNLLFPQLQPGAATQTVEVFSNRGGIPAPEFSALLESEKRMQEEVFVHLPLEQITHYHKHVIHENIQLLSVYLAFSLHPMIDPAKGIPYEGVAP
jgi:hypothetical protein